MIHTIQAINSVFRYTPDSLINNSPVPHFDQTAEGKWSDSKLTIEVFLALIIPCRNIASMTKANM